MKKVWKGVALAGALVCVSVIASATTYHLLDGNSAGGYNGDVFAVNSSSADRSHGFENASLTSGVRGGAGAVDLTEAAERAVQAVVHVKVQATRQVQSQGMIDPFEFFFGGGGQSRQAQPVVGYGSGVIISTDGYILTNNHVVEGSQEISVTLNDNRTLTAKLVGADAALDIALLKMEGKDFPTIPFGDSDKLRLGEWVLAVGNPFNLTGTVTAGIVSAKSRNTASAASAGGARVEAFIQTDAAVNRGNSGGALVNSAGELVGINTMIYSETGNYAGYSFAVPINLAVKVAEDLKKYGTVQRAYLGIAGADVNADLVEKHGLKVNRGVYINDFAEISAAVSAGVEKGDVIVGINGHSIDDFGQLQEQLGRYRPGETIQLTINRKGAEKTLKVLLRNQEGGQGLIKESDTSGLKKLGASFSDLKPEEKRSYGISQGVRVDKVGTGALKNAGISAGFIILSISQRSVANVADLNKVLDAVQRQNASKNATIQIRGFYPNSDRLMTYVIELN